MPWKLLKKRGYHGSSLYSPVYRIQRKCDDVIDYLIAKNDLLNAIIKPTWILKQYKELYDNTQSEITKTNILKELSKILQMQVEHNIQVTNNIPSTPVTIEFGE